MWGGTAGARRSSVGDARLLQRRRLIRVLQCSVWLCWRLAFSAVRRFSGESPVQSFCYLFPSPTLNVTTSPSYVLVCPFFPSRSSPFWPGVVGRGVFIWCSKGKGAERIFYTATSAVAAFNAHHTHQVYAQCHCNEVDGSKQPQHRRLLPPDLSCRILAERMRAALGQGQLQPNASASSNLSQCQSECRPSMPHDWMLEQALSQVMLTTMVKMTVVMVVILLWLCQLV